MILDDIEAVIFDLDGTLADSMGIWEELDTDYLSGFGITLDNPLHEEIEGMCFTETAEYFKKRFQIPDPVETIKEDWNRMAYYKYAEEVRLKPGALEFLKLLKSKNIKMGIATSNSETLVKAVCRHYRLERFISCILTGCDVKKGKPAPDVYLTVADRLHISPGNCLVFEDVVAGIMAGKNAGMKVCGVDDPYSAEFREKKKELADYYIKDYYDLLKERD